MLKENKGYAYSVQKLADAIITRAVNDIRVAKPRGLQIKWKQEAINWVKSNCEEFKTTCYLAHCDPYILRQGILDNLEREGYESNN